MKYALFLGCAIPIKYPGFEAATRLVCERLGIGLVDLPFSCCPPPTSMKLVHYDSWLALAARQHLSGRRERAGHPHAVFRMCEHAKRSEFCF